MPRTVASQWIGRRNPARAACLVVAVGVAVTTVGSPLVPRTRLVAQSAPLAAAPSDTIVKLAVDPARNGGKPFVMLLDDGNFRVEPDGRYVQRMRQVFHVLDANAARGLSERAFGYARSHQSLTIDHVRVLRPNGDVVSDKAAQEQEGDVPAAMNNPVYQEQRLRRISLAGVAPGTIVDVAWTLEEKAPPRAGDFIFQWNLNGGAPVAHSTFALDVPERFMPRIAERNLTFRRSEEVADGRRQLRWVARNLEGRRAEPYEADSNGVTMSVVVTGASTWNDVAGWYHGLARDRYALSPAVVQLVDSVVRAAAPRTRLDSIRAVHKWVAQDIRYVSVALGMGGYQPRATSDVVSTGFGDCKDKATLFVGALRHLRLTADPVLLAQSGRADASLPGIFQFDHAIAVVHEGNRRTYTDLTADLVPYGDLPDRYQGGFGIIVKPNGTAEPIRFPQLPTDSSVSTVRLSMVLDTSGTLRGRVEESTRGNPAPNMRAAFVQPMDDTRRTSLERALAQRLFPNGATADSLVTFNGRDLSAPTTLTYVVTAPNALRTVGENRVLTLSPFIRGGATNFGNTARNLEAQPLRVTPIDASRILGMLTTVTELRITLPEGWTAELPKNVLATSFFGSYESTWTQQGNEVRLVRRIQGQRGVHPPQRITEVIAWFRAASQDSYEFLTLKPAAGR